MGNKLTTYTRMPCGLRNASAIFQSVMEYELTKSVSQSHGALSLHHNNLLSWLRTSTFTHQPLCWHVRMIDCGSVLQSFFLQVRRGVIWSRTLESTNVRPNTKLELHLQYTAYTLLLNDPVYLRGPRPEDSPDYKWPEGPRPVASSDVGKAAKHLSPNHKRPHSPHPAGV